MNRMATPNIQFARAMRFRRLLPAPGGKPLNALAEALWPAEALLSHPIISITSDRAMFVPVGLGGAGLTCAFPKE